MMYILLTILAGVVIALMIPVNGALTGEFGTFPAAAIVHLVGTLLALLICAAQKEKKTLWGHKPKWAYLGGAVGVLTTVFNIMAYGKISMTSIVALGLLGQSITALVIDTCGFLGMQKRPFRKTSLWAIAFAAVGIFVMMDRSIGTRSAVIPVILSIGAGVSVVISRTLNARLAEYTGALRGSLVNHIVGLMVTVVLAFAVMIKNGFPNITAGALRPWIYTGGMLGVACILLNNLCVPRVSAFRMSMLTFSAQILTGILIDIWSGVGYSDTSFTGGILVSAGIIVSAVCEKISEEKARKRKIYFENIHKAEQEHWQKVLKQSF